MPMVQLNVLEGSLNESEKTKLIEDLTETILRVEEAPDTPQAKSIAWVFINEFKQGNWAIAGKPVSGLKFLTNVTVPSGSLDDQRKEKVAEEVFKCLVRNTGEKLNPMESWVIINEVADGNWSAGGRVFRMKNIADYVGSAKDSKRYKEVTGSSN